MQAKHIFLFGELTMPRLTRDVLDAVVNPEGVHLVLWLSGPGTDAPVYRALHGMLRHYRADDRLETRAVGDVESGYVILATLGSPGLRFAHRYAIFGLHEPYLSAVTEDPAAQAVERAALEKERKYFYDLLAELTGRQRAWWRRRLKGKSMLYLEPHEAKRAGLVDDIFG